MGSLSLLLSNGMIDKQSVLVVVEAVEIAAEDCKLYFVGFEEILQYLMMEGPSTPALCLGEFLSHYWPEIAVPIGLLTEKLLCKLAIRKVPKRALHKLHWLFPSLSQDTLRQLVLEFCACGIIVNHQDDISELLWKQTAKALKRLEGEKLQDGLECAEITLEHLFTENRFEALAAASSSLLSRMVKIGSTAGKKWLERMLTAFPNVPAVLQAEWIGVIGDALLTGLISRSAAMAAIQGMLNLNGSETYRQNFVFMVNQALRVFPDLINVIIEDGYVDIFLSWATDAAAIADNVASFCLSLALLCDTCDDQLLINAFDRIPPADFSEAVQMAEKLTKLRPKLENASTEIKIAYIHVLARIIAQTPVQLREAKLSTSILEPLRNSLRTFAISFENLAQILGDWIDGSHDKMDRLMSVFDPR
jgi:hypothetical protein